MRFHVSTIIFQTLFFSQVEKKEMNGVRAVRQINQPAKTQQRAFRQKAKNVVYQKKPLLIKAFDLKCSENVCDILNGSHPQVRLVSKPTTSFEWTVDGETWSKDASIQLFNSPVQATLVKPRVPPEQYVRDKPYIASMRFELTEQIVEFDKFFQQLRRALEFDLVSKLTGVSVDKGMTDKDFIKRALGKTTDEEVDVNCDVIKMLTKNNIVSSPVSKSIMDLFHDSIKRLHGFNVPILLRDEYNQATIDFKYTVTNNATKLVKDKNGNQVLTTLFYNKYLDMTNSKKVTKCSVIFTPSIELGKTEKNTVARINFKVRQLFVDDDTKIVETSWFTFAEEK